MNPLRGREGRDSEMEGQEQGRDRVEVFDGKVWRDRRRGERQRGAGEGWERPSECRVLVHGLIDPLPVASGVDAPFTMRRSS